MKKTPSERISLIQDISTTFQNEEWSIIDLTLRQFGLPTTENWPSNNRESYIIQMIESATDETLAQLYFHLTRDKSLPYASGLLEFWQPGTYRIFLSHITKYKEQAKELKDQLETLHISTFVAHADIKPTKEWQDEIELAINSADCLVALVSEGFHESFWTDQEIGIAIGKDKLIIPVECGGNPYGFLGKYQWLKNENFDVKKMKDDIFKILSKNNLSKRKFSEALVNKFESSHSFASARDNIYLLESVEYLDSDMLNKIQLAHDKNEQINESFGVTRRVQNLIAKMTNPNNI